MRPHIKYYMAAGISIQVNSDFPITENTFHPKFKLFEVITPGKDLVRIYHHFHLPDISKALNVSKKEIYKKDQWHIIQAEDYWIYKYTPVYRGDTGYPATGIFNKDHSIFDIYSPDIDEEKYKNGRFEALTLFNSDQVLFSKLLCDRNGIIIHSNGFDIHGNGILLAGKSGAGKSTLSKMLIQDGYQIFCDDRMFVIHKNNNLSLYGNWCHGTVVNVSPGCVPLKAIFFLEQSKTNSIEPLDNKHIVLQRLTRSMVKPILSQVGWDITLAVLDAIVSTIRCYKLKFDLSGKICKILTDLFNDD